MSRSAWVLVASLLAACGPSLMTVRYRVPLLDNPAGEEAARRCARRCEVTNDADADALARCVGGCPGTQIAENRACDGSAANRPPYALCYEREEPRERTTHSREPSGGGDVLLAILGGLLDVAAAAATHDHDDADEPTSSFEPTDPEPEPRAEPQERDRPGRKAADPEPRRERTAADPKRR